MTISEQDILRTLMKSRDRIAAAAWVVVRDAHAAEDIFQNVALKALTKEVSFEAEGAVLSWAFITARREGIDWLRRHRKEPTGIDPEISELLEQEWLNETAHSGEVRMEALRACLKTLPEKSSLLLRLRYFEGSAVTISGNSTLTFSDHGQKKLHLKEGSVSGNVKPQPAGKPMLIYTRSAMLEVLGTQFEVEAGLAATMLNVSKGKVLVKRFSDGRTVEVRAKHRVIAAADQEMLPVPVPDSVSRWKSQLHLGPDSTYGKWSPETNTEDTKLGAIPYTIPQGTTIYTVGFGISLGDEPPVILEPDSNLIVRGHIASRNKVYFGLTIRHPEGEFAGRFQTIRPAVEFQDGQDFEVLLELRDFTLDPSLIKMKDKLPSDPFHLVIETIWCHTLNQQAGLEIVEVELLPPTTSVIPSPEPAPLQPPIMDIWAAASKSNLEAVKRHFAAGADIDEAFVAPGIPASGATPLHLAVLSDQGEIAQFLIEKRANINAKAERVIQLFDGRSEEK